MIRKTVFLVLVLLLSCRYTPDNYETKVTRVIDGDTVVLADGRLLRYIGIDTPETRIKKDGEFIYSPQPFALEAKERNRQLVEGKIVKLEFDVTKKDRYGRLLAYCFTDGIFVNARLLEEGYAVLYTYPPNVKYTGLFVSLQKQARAEKKGLWGSFEIIDQKEAQDHINQIRTVEGKVLKSYRSNHCVFLNFGKNWQKDFTVVIFNNTLFSFKKQGINPLTSYTGKTIRVTGRIRQYNGPEIIVNNPSEIEVVEE